VKSAVFAVLVAFTLMPPIATACTDHAPGTEPVKKAVGRESAWIAGEVREVDLDESTITLGHAKIATLNMEAMTSMSFKARDRSVIAGAKPGDKVKFRTRIVAEQPTVTRLAIVR
jgi:Cu/Ag efflux protein CusF